MASYRWGVVCSGAGDSKENPSRLDLAGVLDELHIGGLDVGLAEAGVAVEVNVTVVTVWHRDDWEIPERAQMRLVFCNPRGEQLADSNEQAMKLDVFPIVRMIGKIPVWPVKGGFGVYSLRVDARAESNADWKPVGEIKVGVWQGPPGPTANTSVQGVGG